MEIYQCSMHKHVVIIIFLRITTIVCFMSIKNVKVFWTDAHLILFILCATFYVIHMYKYSSVGRAYLNKLNFKQYLRVKTWKNMLTLHSYLHITINRFLSIKVLQLSQKFKKGMTIHPYVWVFRDRNNKLLARQGFCFL